MIRSYTATTLIERVKSCSATFFDCLIPFRVRPEQKKLFSAKTSGQKDRLHLRSVHSNRHNPHACRATFHFSPWPHWAGTALCLHNLPSKSAKPDQPPCDSVRVCMYTLFNQTKFLISCFASWPIKTLAKIYLYYCFHWSQSILIVFFIIIIIVCPSILSFFFFFCFFIEMIVFF